MEINFDKQIDTILQDLAKGNTFAENSHVSHLDADELSAFAENVLPAKARLRAMEHLADCNNCRKTLNTFFSLIDEAESETIHEKTIPVVSIPIIPWYQKLFAFPNLSYAMGALSLLLVGMIGILLWQNSQDTQNSLAKNEPVADKAVQGGPSAEGIDNTFGSYSANAANAASNTVSSNTGVAATNSTVTQSSPATVNNNLTQPKTMATPAAVGSSNTAMPIDEPTSSKSAGAGSSDAKTEEKERKVLKKSDESNQPEAEVSAGGEKDDSTNLAQQRVETQQNRAQNNVTYPDGESREAKRSAPVPPPATSAKKNAGRREDSAKDEAENKAEAKPIPTKNVGGKTFSNVNRIWTDSTYRGGTLTNIKRNSDEYKKLDSNLRSIADYLGGTVIIVWKSKNYKIQ